MLVLTYNAGLRVSELLGLALEDLKRPPLDEVRINGNGRQERILPLWKETSAALRDWLAIRPKSTDRCLFLDAKGSGMTRRGFAQRLALHAQTAAESVRQQPCRPICTRMLQSKSSPSLTARVATNRSDSCWVGFAPTR